MLTTHNPHRGKHNRKRLINLDNMQMEQKRRLRKRRTKYLINVLFVTMCILALFIIIAIIFSYTIDK